MSFHDVIASPGRPNQTPTTSGLMVQRMCACGTHTRDGECDECRKRRMLQRRSQSIPASGSALAPPIVHEVLQTPGHPLDAATRTLMEPRFGRDLSSVRVHADAKAARSAQAVNARAYTVGRSVVFGTGQYAPHTDAGRQLLAHELTHVVQQKGKTAHQASALPIASASDSFEREAHEVARQVRAADASMTRQGHSRDVSSPAAHAPLNRLSPVNTRGGAPAVQRYTIYDTEQQQNDQSKGWMHPGAKPLMIADTGEMAVEYKPWHSQMAWARSTLITQSNHTLNSRGSKIRLKAGSAQIEGMAPDGHSTQKQTLHEVEVTDPGGSPGTLTGDCGTACLEGMGGHGPDEFVGVTRVGGTTAKTPAVPYRGGWGRGSNPTTNELSGYIYQEIMKKEFAQTLTPDEARAAYDKLPDEKKDEIDRKYGINRYAIADVGQGLTAGTEFNMPGFKTDAELKKEQNMLIGGLSGLGAGLLLGGGIGFAAGGPLGLLAGALIGGLLLGALGLGIGAGVDTSDENTWNFHFATTILRSGHDYVTIENVARRSSSDWLFMMYGPADQGQSFHDFQGRAEHGNKLTSMVVDKP